jgi:hypothetical protein
MNPTKMCMYIMKMTIDEEIRNDNEVKRPSRVNTRDVLLRGVAVGKYS